MSWSTARRIFRANSLPLFVLVVLGSYTLHITRGLREKKGDGRAGYHGFPHRSSHRGRGIRACFFDHSVTCYNIISTAAMTDIS